MENKKGNMSDLTIWRTHICQNFSCFVGNNHQRLEERAVQRSEKPEMMEDGYRLISDISATRDHYCFYSTFSPTLTSFTTEDSCVLSAQPVQKTCSLWSAPTLQSVEAGRSPSLRWNKQSFVMSVRRFQKHQWWNLKSYM